MQTNETDEQFWKRRDEQEHPKRRPKKFDFKINPSGNKYWRGHNPFCFKLLPDDFVFAEKLDQRFFELDNTTLVKIIPGWKTYFSFFIGSATIEYVKKIRGIATQRYLFGLVDFLDYWEECRSKFTEILRNEVALVIRETKQCEEHQDPALQLWLKHLAERNKKLDPRRVIYEMQVHIHWTV